MEHPTRISNIDRVNIPAESPPAVMTGRKDAACSSSATVSTMKKDNRSTKPLRPTASVFVPGALQVEDAEQAALGYIYNPHNIFQTTQPAGLRHVHNPYRFLQPTHRVVLGMMMSCAPQRLLFGKHGPGSVGSGSKQIEEAKHDAKQEVQDVQGSEPKARANAPAKKPKERGEEGRTSKARKRGEVRARKRAERAAVVGEVVVPTREDPETSAE